MEPSVSAADGDSLDRDPLDLVAEEFAQRCRQGETPDIDDYAARYPGLEEEIRELLPAVALLEQGKRSAQQSGVGLSDTLNVLGQNPALPPFARLGDNRLIREIGRGGMGVVYEAVQEPLGRRVAVKILPRHSPADAVGRQRFFREAQVVARLDHPHIVPIYSLGEHEGVPYYVMALVDGQGLDRLLAAGSPVVPKDPRTRCRWAAHCMSQAAEALAYAHEEGVLHRDLKPANLLLDTKGKLWLADFGLAKLADDLSLTSTGELPGTLRYLAPECLHEEATTASDIYSLGLTLYELAIGHPAFPGSNRGRLLREIESHQMVPPRERAPWIDRDLETILLKSTDREPAARYASARVLAEDLRRYLDGRPIQARRAGAVARLRSWARRNPTVAWLGLLSIILGLATLYLARFYPAFRPPWGRERFGRPMEPRTGPDWRLEPPPPPRDKGFDPPI